MIICQIIIRGHDVPNDNTYKDAVIKFDQVTTKNIAQNSASGTIMQRGNAYIDDWMIKNMFTCQDAGTFRELNL